MTVAFSFIASALVFGAIAHLIISLQLTRLVLYVERIVAACEEDAWLGADDETDDDRGGDGPTEETPLPTGPPMRARKRATIGIQRNG